MGFRLVPLLVFFFLTEVMADDFVNHPHLRDLEKGQKLFADFEEGQSTSLYAFPNTNIVYIAAVKGGDELTYLDHKLIQQNKKWDDLFLKVRWKNPDPQKDESRYVEGWINANRVRPNQVFPVFSRSLNHPSGACWAPSASGKNQDSLRKTCDLNTQQVFVNRAVDDIAKSIKGFIGKCVEPKPGQTDPDRLVYDQHILPQFKNLKWPSRPMKKDSGVPITKKDLVAIDAVARTLYGEMARCHRYGLQYPMGVAAVLFKRANFCNGMAIIEKEQFCRYNFVDAKSPHGKEKNWLTRVATEPRQIDTWRVDQNSNQSLCPPSDMKKKFYSGGLPSEEEHRIWNDMVRIATEMVLFPKHFTTYRIPGFSHYFYSSLPAVIDTFKKSEKPPVLAGRSLDNGQCTQFYDDQPDFGPLMDQDSLAEFKQRMAERTAERTAQRARQEKAAIQKASTRQPTYIKPKKEL